ncbi:MAG: lamin tail domain-containing protein [Gaiellaceae bacterium]
MNRTRTSLLVLLAVVLLAVPAAQASSPDLVLSQIFAGGGNAGATFANDYIELFNRGSSTVDLTGWSVQYAPGTSTSWSPTALAGTVAPGRHYLVELASAGAVGSALPAADASGTTNLAASGGKVALVRDATALTCGTAAGSCSAVATVRDLVGYGSATDYEGSAAAAALSSTTALVRAAGGCTDTDSNAADFTAATPAPRNSSATASPCGGASASGVSQSASVDVDVQPSLSLTLERAALSFGSVGVGSTPAPVSERVTVTSTGATGYALSVHRVAFTPSDLPLAISASAPTGAQLASPLAGGAFVGVPIAPATDLLLGTTAAASAAGGDVWPTSFAFVPAVPAVAPGHYTASVTYTVIGR